MAHVPHAEEKSRSYVPSRHQQSSLSPAVFWALIRKTFCKWNDDPTLRFGAGLAYYTAFAVVPLVFIVVELGSYVVGRGAAKGLLYEQVEGVVGEQGAQAVEHLLESWEQASVIGYATLVEASIMFFALAGAFDVLQDALNAIWGVEPKQDGRLLTRVRKRFLSVAGILGTAFLLLVSLVLTSLFSAGSRSLFTFLPAPALVSKGLTAVISFVGVTLLFAMIFKLLPKAKVAWRDVWIGAVVTAVLFTIGKTLILLYLAKTLIVSLYGAAAPLVIVLLWSFFSAQILLFGAEFTAVYASDCGSRLVPTDDAVAVGEPAKTNEAVRQSAPLSKAS